MTPRACRIGPLVVVTVLLAVVAGPLPSRLAARENAQLQKALDCIQREGECDSYVAAIAPRQLESWRKRAKGEDREAQWFLGKCYELRAALDAEVRAAADAEVQQGLFPGVWANESAILWSALASEGKRYPGVRSRNAVYGKEMHYWGWAYRKAFRCFEDSAKRGFAPAQVSLGRLYARGRGVKESIDESLRWYTKAANQGYVPAQFELGRYYERVALKRELAVEWLRRASDGGNCRAIAHLAELLCADKGPEEHRKEVATLRNALIAKVGEKDAENLLRLARLRWASLDREPGPGGTPAPELRGATVDGRPFVLSECAGKIVLLKLSQYSCGPSREMDRQYVPRLLRRMQGRPFEFLNVDIDLQPLPMDRDWIIRDNVPIALLIDPAGVIRCCIVGYASEPLDKALDAMSEATGKGKEQDSHRTD